MEKQSESQVAEFGSPKLHSDDLATVLAQTHERVRYPRNRRMEGSCVTSCCLH